MNTRRLIPAGNPPLADTLRLLLPSAHTKLLLQAALCQGHVVGKAWSQWRREVLDSKAFLASDRVGMKRHLPLLYRNLVSHGVNLGRDIEPYFRAARAREELRSTRYRRYLGEALSALRQSGIDFVVGKGVTVGETIHTDPVVRHNHDVDLFVRTKSLTAAAVALQVAGFVPSSTSATSRFDHESGLPIELHDRLYRTPFYDSSLDGLWGRARRGEVLGMPVRLISDADLLVHAPVHASLVPHRRGLSWVIDVVTLLQKRAAEGFATDWTAVLQLARETQATLPLYVTYRFIAETFDAPIPPQVINELSRAAAQIGTAQRLIALDGLRSEVQTSGIRMLMGASGWQSRFTIAKSLLLPPPSYLKARQSEVELPPVALLYVTRPLRFVARQIRRARYRSRLWLARRMSRSQADAAIAKVATTTIAEVDQAAAIAGRSSA